MSIFEQLKTSLSCIDIITYYHSPPNRKKVRCPFHSDKHPSMLVDSEHFYCFSCFAHGDGINFVAKLFNISNFEAATKIANDFHLNIPNKTHKQVTYHLSQKRIKDILATWEASSLQKLINERRRINIELSKITCECELLWHLLEHRDRMIYLKDMLSEATGINEKIQILKIIDNEVLENEKIT